MPNYPKKNTGYLLPFEIDPPQIGVCVPVPNDANHIRAFMGALYDLTYWNNWEKSSGHEGKEAAAVWSDIYDIVRERIGVELCDSADAHCYHYSNTSGIVSYYPNDPRYTPTLVPDGYNYPPWYFSTAASELAYGTKAGDIVTSLDRFPPGSLPTILPASGLPRIRVNVNVTGDAATLRVYLRNMVGGSIVQTTVDDDILTLALYDVTKDLIGIPPETGDLVIIEHEFTTTGAHYMDLIVVSRVNDEIPFLFHGGAIEHIEICQLPVEEPAMDCCESTTVLLNTITAVQAGDANRRRTEAYDGTPASISASAPDDTFSGDGNTFRYTALCLALREYVYQQIYRAGATQCVLDGFAAGLAGIGGFLIGGPLGAIVGGVVIGAAVNNCAGWQTIIEDAAALNDLVCDLYSQFNSLGVSQANFESAMSSLAGAGTVEDMLAAGASSLENYTWFLDLLGEGYAQAQAGVVDDCVCDQGWTTISYNQIEGTAALSEHEEEIISSNNAHLIWNHTTQPDRWTQAKSDIGWDAAGTTAQVVVLRMTGSKENLNISDPGAGNCGPNDGPPISFVGDSSIRGSANPTLVSAGVWEYTFDFGVARRFDGIVVNLKGCNRIPNPASTYYNDLHFAVKSFDGVAYP